MYYIAKDYRQALYWYQKRAEQGDASAQYNLGGMYYKGEDTLKDYQQALYWYRKSAEKGNNTLSVFWD
ncbi:MAG: hypothetical protein OXH57_12600 [Ekhidna sp.]|nr:hypothetical protein [Ekhidna sp.]